ncbi:MAG: ATP-binding cassette domain-containing protein [Nannocystaceae bacterium]
MTYGRGPRRHAALRAVSIAVPEGAFAVLLGPSGAGKSTLLKLVLAMERPDEGRIHVAGRDIQRLRKASIPYLRRNVGVVFQDFKLLLDAPPMENVALALQVLGMPRREVRERAASALARVELDPGIRRPARCLSGGEQQRVAIARAVAGDPAILLADEPTGNLDPRLTREIVDVLEAIRARGTTVLLATHDPLVLDLAPLTQQIHLEHGRVISLGESVGPSGLRDEDDIPEILPASWAEPTEAVA